MHILPLVTDNNPSSISVSQRLIVEIISRSISTKVWDRTGIELATPGSAVRLASDCATGPSHLPNMKRKTEIFPALILLSFLLMQSL